MAWKRKDVVAVCLHHNLRLLEQCASCNTAFKIPALWTNGRCHHCGTKFTPMAISGAGYENGVRSVIPGYSAIGKAIFAHFYCLKLVQIEDQKVRGAIDRRKAIREQIFGGDETGKT